MSKFIVPEHKFSSLNSKLTTIINKCKRAGVGYIYEVGDVYPQRCVVHHFDKENHLEYRKDAIIPCREIELELQYRVDGWQVLGVVNKKDGVSQTYFKDVSLCAKYADVDMKRCDHCKTKRLRKSVVVIQNIETGEVMVVGATCCKEFTHGLDGALCSEWCSAYYGLVHISVNDCETECYFDERDVPRLSDVSCLFNKVITPLAVVVASAYMIDKHGFVSSSEAQVTREDPTSYYVKELMKDCRGRYAVKYVDREDENIKTAEDLVRLGAEDLTQAQIDTAYAAFNWCKNLTDEQVDSSYLFNLRTICREEEIDSRDMFAGMLTSLIPTYFRHVAKIEREKRLSEKQESKHMFQVGDKIDVVAKLEDIVSFETFASYYGSNVTKFIYKFRLDGNLLVWVTDNKNLGDCVGKSVSVKGSVKGHTEYKGVKQTQLTRCKVKSL